jgi:rhodanese-related sulfurtransferase
MPINEVTVTNAQATQAAGTTYVDVRSTQEFEAGHPAGAVNVPLLEPDEDTGQMMPNPDFVRVMQANFSPDTPLLLGCKTGGRSARAAQMLEAFGYGKLTNVAGGFVDWSAKGLPTETTASPGGSYTELLNKADG